MQGLGVSEHVSSLSKELQRIERQFQRQEKRIKKNIEAKKRADDWQKERKQAYEAVLTCLVAANSATDKARNAAMKADIELLRDKAETPEDLDRAGRTIQQILHGNRRYGFTCKHWRGDE